jgi:hypothetical protein
LAAEFRLHNSLGELFMHPSRGQDFLPSLQIYFCTITKLLRVAVLASAAGFSLWQPAAAAPVLIPNSDFSDAANNGSIGGGVIGAQGSGPIGVGPWNGTYAGVAAFLAPPLLTIAPGQATVSQLAVGVLGIANSGEFSQNLAATYLPAKHYVLAANVTASSVLALDALTTGNVGLALNSGATALSSTQSSPTVALKLLNGGTYHIALGYDSAPSDTGSIGVGLFAYPNGVLAADLASTIVFSNVALTQAPIPALPANHILPATGTPQAATVNTAFPAPLVVKVTDVEGDPLQGINVTFTAPGSGASAVLSTTTVMTDISGEASVTGTANGTTGRYAVSASVNGLAQTASFDLSNTGAGQPAVTSVASGDQGQIATVGMPFGCLLAVKVIAGADPAAGATVMFLAPLTGASAVLSDGVSSGPLLFETTDANGVAMIAASANSIAGSYAVNAFVTALTSGVLATPLIVATYPLTNFAATDRLFADGFEEVPSLCGSF